MIVIRKKAIDTNHQFFAILHKTERSQFAVMTLKEGEVSGDFGTDHPNADQILIMLEGEGELRVENQSSVLLPGDVAIIPAGKKHRVKGPCKSLNVYAPPAYPDEPGD